MRLINTDTLLVEEFMGDYHGRYAILSHTWEKDEVSFQDMTLIANDQSPDSDKTKTKAGYQKVAAFAKAAAADGFSRVWVDTCCIDKSSSAELSEAINSMFRWYSKASRCYVYLADVPDGWEASLPHAFEHHDHGGALLTVDIPAHLRRMPWPVRGAVDHSFYQSRWFTRGWTLQELLAPVDVVFYSSAWTRGPTKTDLIEHLGRITGIPHAALETGDCSAVSIADRMRWALARETTRVEDTAYCLLGIFDVNMPMLYGEGEKAFLRLQEEICRSSDDHSLFAWRQKPVGDEWSLSRSNSDQDPSGGAFSVYRGLFAKSPEEFSVPSVSLAPVDADGFVPPMGSTSLGFNAMFPLIPVSEISIMNGVVPAVDSVDAENEFLAVLHAKTLLSWHRPGVRSLPGHRVAILVKALLPNASTRQFVRVRPSIVYTLTGRTKSTLPAPMSLYFRHAIRIPTNHVSRRWAGFVVDVSYRAVPARFGVWSPHGVWKSKADLISTPANLAKTNGVAAVVFSIDPAIPFVAFLGRSPRDGSPVFWLLKEKVEEPAKFDFSRISRMEGVKVGDDPPQRVLRFLYSPQSGSTVVLYFTLSWLPRLVDDMLDRDLAALALTNHRLNAIVEPILYKFGARGDVGVPLKWAAENGLAGTLRKALAAGAHPSHDFVEEISRAEWRSLVAAEKKKMARLNDNDEAEDWSSNIRFDRADQTRARHHAARHPMVIEMDESYPLDEEAQLYGTSIVEYYDDYDGYGDYDDYDDYDDMDDNPETGLNPREMEELETGAVGWTAPTYDSTYVGYADGDPRLPLNRSHTPLHIAAQKGHNHVIEILLDNGADVDASSQWFLCGCQSRDTLWESVQYSADDVLMAMDWTPLHVAMCSSHPVTAKLLISRGATQVSYSDGILPFHDAAAFGLVDVLRLLVEKLGPAKIDAPDDNGMTPLYYACADRRWDSTVPLLLEYGADINVLIPLDFDDWDISTTMFGEACRLGRFEDALKLLDLGADMGCGIEFKPQPDCEGTRAVLPLLHVCCLIPIEVELQAPHPDHGTVNMDGETPWHWRTTLITKLLTAGAPIDGKWDDGKAETPLIVAAKHGTLPALNVLLRAGADIHARDSDGQNALMAAVAVQYWHLPQTEQGEGYFGFQPTARLMTMPKISVERLSLVVRRLLDAGTRVNDQDTMGRTVLHLFFPPSTCQQVVHRESDSRWGNLLRLLLAHGADPLLKDNEGRSAFDYAFRGRFLAGCEILIRHRGGRIIANLPPNELWEMFVELAEDPSFDPFYTRQQLLDLALDLDATKRILSDKEVLKRLLRAAGGTGSYLSYQRYAAECLSSRGHQAMILDLQDKLAIFDLAVKSGSAPIARRLIEDGVDSNTTNDAGESILFQVLKQQHTRSTQLDDLIKYLVASGANIHLPSPNAAGVTPLGLLFSRGAALLPLKMVEWMLNMQPLRGNPQAAEALYLHHAVSLEGKYSPHISPEPFSGLGRIPNHHVIERLLAAGADRNALDYNGDTPLSLFLGQLTRQRTMVGAFCSLINPLSRGVDINQKNAQSFSAADYLEDLLDVDYLHHRSAVLGRMALERILDLEDLEGGRRKLIWHPVADY
ncbi:hypothetical protein B0T22DRAFT_480415 [Podospora appendiculata]|uniref:Heterokaryon incompatibility domain-containing protein n=1 Tax=Podospora appendiculata TaxID=314037 RepID=A0AAE0XB50_9PEZI|nr:hypothetical protein B0T22DRAFT_480415 [Podospora appendiculata]